MIMEEHGLSKVSSYLNSYSIYNSIHSAYHPGHSAHTALLKVANDPFSAPNEGNNMTMLVFLTRVIICRN